MSLLFHLYGCHGVGFAIAEDIDLSVMEYLLRCGGICRRYYGRYGS